MSLITLPVTFHTNDGKLADLKVLAHQIDLDNNGEAAVEYTEEQALAVVFHDGGTEALQKVGYLAGWTVDKDLQWGEFA